MALMLWLCSVRCVCLRVVSAQERDIAALLDGKPLPPKKKTYLGVRTRHHPGAPVPCDVLLLHAPRSSRKRATAEQAECVRRPSHVRSPQAA